MLVEGEPRPGGAQLRRYLGAAARSLASTRDCHIIHDAIADLAADKRRKPLDAALARKVTSTLSRAAGSPREADANLARRCARPGCRRTWTTAAQLVDAMDAADLPEALAAGYRRARRAARGIDRADADALHELRKHVVAHVCQMELAAPWWPRLGFALGRGVAAPAGGAWPPS